MNKIRVLIYNNDSGKLVCWKDHTNSTEADQYYKEMKKLEGVHAEWKHMR